MISYTHRKRPYHANAIQLTAYNLDEVIRVIRETNREVTASQYGPHQIMVRFANPLPRQCTPDVISVGDWVVVGENGVAKVYTQEQFNIKYEELTG